MTPNVVAEPQALNLADVCLTFMQDDEASYNNANIVSPSIDSLEGINNEDSQVDLDAVDKKIKMRQNEEKHQWRKMYLGRSFYLAGYVLYVSLSFLLFSAVGVFTISDNVLIALLTTMVANVLGVLAIAFYWLYQK